MGRHVVRDCQDEGRRTVEGFAAVEPGMTGGGEGMARVRKVLTRRVRARSSIHPPLPSPLLSCHAYLLFLLLIYSFTSPKIWGK